MPIIEPVNTQQVLQMGAATEKLQQTIQSLPATTAQHLDEERKELDEMKNTEVFESEESQNAEQTNPEGKNRRGRLRTRKTPTNSTEDVPVSAPAIVNPDPFHGHKIDVRI